MRIATAAERLKQALSESGMQPAELAKAIGLNKSSVSRYLSGQYEPKQEAINKMAMALNVSEMWLWGYDVDKERADWQKENDDLTEITVRMRRSKSFFEAVKKLHKLSNDDFETISRLLSTLGDK